jgi:hypothetical protein
MMTEGKTRIATFREGLQQLGWTDGWNIRIDITSLFAREAPLALVR